jgi:tetratricopeptide (TPR) repeat protein
VSQVPAEIAGIGSTLQKLRVSPGFDPLKAAVGPEEYFIFSRIDGTQSLRDVLFASGLPMDKAVKAVTNLRALGALLLPGENAPPAAAQKPQQPKTGGTAPYPTVDRTPGGRSQRTPSTSEGIILNHDLRLLEMTPEESSALAEQIDIAEGERRLILAMQRVINDPFALLGVSSQADAKSLKRAYFTLSKAIHPDRYYGKNLGTFAHRTTLVFEATSRAYARLTGNQDKRSPVGTGSHATQEAQQQPQTPQEYAAELFDRACQLEVGGDALGAMKLFAAAVRVDSQPRYLRRAASCALAAQQPRSAVEYAKKAHTLAPNDPSAARLLAASFRAAGKLADAEEVLVMAMALKNENDVLTAELRNDLAEVRRLLRTP